MKYFLLIRLSSMGDVILTTALIRCIKNSFPASQIDFITNYQYKEIIEHNPYINKCWEYDKKNPIYPNYDISNYSDISELNIIDLQNNHRSKKIIKNISKSINNCNVAIYNKMRFQKLALVYFKKNYFRNNTVTARYINTAAKFGINNDNKELELWLPNEKQINNYPPENKKTNFIINSLSKNRIFAIAPSAKHKTKQWLPENFVQLIIKINNKYNPQKFYLLGGTEDWNLCSEIIVSVRQNTETNSIELINHSGKTSIIETAKLLDECELLITNDSGIMHIGAARRIPIISIFGSTVPELGFAPFGVSNKICEANLKCRPCSHIGKKKCPKGHYNCMKMIEPIMVLNAVDELINELSAAKINDY